MKSYSVIVLFVTIAIISCKPKEKTEDKKFISVLSLLEKQVEHVDTSLYSITKVVSTDTLHHDTTYIPREDFRSVAKDFLDIPDLSSPKISKNYQEETRYDDLLNRVIITYTPIKDGDEEIKKQELQVTPDIAAGDRVNNVMITRVVNNRNGFLKKDMLWQMDRSFQITTTSQLPGQPEIITTTKVTWNEDSYK